MEGDPEDQFTIRLRLGGFNSYFGTGSDLPNTIDLETGERRPSLLDDVRAYAKLCDELPNLDFVMSIAQLWRPRTPVVFGSGSGPMDMRLAVGTYASPEFMLHCQAMAELAHHRYHLPVWGFSGCSDSKLPDLQAGIESALWILWTALSGANLVHDLGYLESGLTGSFQMVVVCDETVSFVRRLLRGIELSDETLALEAIAEVGPGGDFLGSAHTMRHFRSIWMPALFDRNNHHGWVEAGQPNTIQTARDRAIELIGNHQPDELPESVVETLSSIVAEAEARAGAGQVAAAD